MADVRSHNVGLVLTRVDRAGAIARTGLAAATGLAPGAITLLVGELMDAGMLREIDDPVRESGPGRPRRALAVAGERIGVVGVRFVLDEVFVSAVDLAGRDLVRERAALHTPPGDPEAVADQLAAVVARVRRVLDEAGVTPVRLVVVAPAPVLQPGEIIPVAIDLGWRDVDLAALLRERIPPLPLGLRVMNDANAAAYAEFAELEAASSGEKTPVTDVVYLKSDTGIGGGAVSGGQLLTGVNGVAFEPGHVIVLPDGVPCPCGRRGCLVTVAGPDVVVERAGLGAFRSAHGLPAALAELVRRERAGDVAAVAAVSDALRWIEIVLANCVAILQPQVVVVGGYLSGYADRLRSTPVDPDAAPGIPSAPVRGAVHGDDAEVDGAVLRERRDLLSHPWRVRDALREGEAASI